MDEATSLDVRLRSLVPLRLREVEYTDPRLTIIGDDWSGVMVGDWAWRRGDRVLTAWGDAGAEDVVWDLCGLDLVGVQFPDPRFAGDCSFILSDGRLDVRSDRSGFETWTFQHAKLDVVFVGL